MKELMLHHLITNTQMAWDLFPQFQSDKTYYGNHTFQISSPSLPRHLCLKASQMVMTRGLYLHTDYLLPPSPPPPPPHTNSLVAKIVVAKRKDFKHTSAAHIHNQSNINTNQRTAKLTKGPHIHERPHTLTDP